MSHLFTSTRDNVTAYVNFNQSKDTGLTPTKMTRNDELPRHLIPDSESPRFLQATVAEWTANLDTSAITIISPAVAKDLRKPLPTELCSQDMSTVRGLAKKLELLQRPNVDGVFLVIGTQTKATLNDLLLHHRHLQYALSCLLRQFSSGKSPWEISRKRLCKVMRMFPIDQGANCMRVFHLEAFRFLTESGLRKVP